MNPKTTEREPENRFLVNRISMMLLSGIVLMTAVAAAGLSQSTSPPQPILSKSATGLPQPVIGFTLNVHHIGDLPLYLQSVDAIADLGANSLNIVTPWFVERNDSTEIRSVSRRCPTRPQLLAILRKARERGLHTSLLPIVLIEKPEEGEWRGTLLPTDWNAWWESYTAFADWFSQLAVDADVDLLFIGSELNSTELHASRWLTLAKRVRSKFDGTIAYTANWDRYEKVTFWGLVDVIGVSAYFELERDRPGAPLPDLIHAWAKPRAALTDFARRWKKPLLLAEIGYPSLPWANAHPWNYVAQRGMKADHVTQARCWEAFFAAWATVLADPGDQLAGFYGYHWDPYHRGQSYDTGYGVRGKPAHRVIRDGFADIRESAARLADQNVDR